MPRHNRRHFLRAAAGLAGAAALPPAIAQALAIKADRRSGTLADVSHIVCLMMENRSFDHYFGGLPGVRGFADPFPVPVPDREGLRGKTVWYQRNDDGAGPAVLAPQRNDTTADFALIRTADTPHLYPDAQEAWDHGRMNRWPQFKRNASMVYYEQADIPFQFALADAFTVCDAYHCSFTGGTNPNRCFFFTGSNHGRDDPARPGAFMGPAMDNRYSMLRGGDRAAGYGWTTYAERLEAAGVSWQVYQNEEVDYFALNPLLGFEAFRTAQAAPDRTPLQHALVERGIRTRDLDLLRADVLAGRLAQVSWICPTATGSEHPGPSSPAQGAGYVARVLEALTANPEVWSRTVLFVNFDENDGFFDHGAPPAPPSCLKWDADPARAEWAGASTVDARDDYLGEADGGVAAVRPYRNRPLGLGPRVPMLVVSPWSKGGHVSSQVFDHTSTIRFIERRFGVHEPNISAWRRAVCGDLVGCFDFAAPDDASFAAALPATAERDAASRKFAKTKTPETARQPVLPQQPAGVRRSRALPYELHAGCRVAVDGVELSFANSGQQAAVFHVYDRLNLAQIPRRYTVEPGRSLEGSWRPAAGGDYDLWVLAPNGWHRHFVGNAAREAAAGGPELEVGYDLAGRRLKLLLRNRGAQAQVWSMRWNAYRRDAGSRHEVPPGGEALVEWALADSGGWYDLSVGLQAQAGFGRRLAGRLETGADSISDPAMHGPAVGDQYRFPAFAAPEPGGGS